MKRIFLLVGLIHFCFLGMTQIVPMTSISKDTATILDAKEGISDETFEWTPKLIREAILSNAYGVQEINNSLTITESGVYKIGTGNFTIILKDTSDLDITILDPNQLLSANPVTVQMESATDFITNSEGVQTQGASLLLDTSNEIIRIYRVDGNSTDYFVSNEVSINNSIAENLSSDPLQLLKVGSDGGFFAEGTQAYSNGTVEQYGPQNTTGGLITESVLQGSYDANIIGNAPDIIPQEIIDAAAANASVGNHIYLGENQWWLNLNNGDANSWTAVDGPGNSGKGSFTVDMIEVWSYDATVPAIGTILGTHNLNGDITLDENGNLQSPATRCYTENSVTAPSNQGQVTKFYWVDSDNTSGGQIFNQNVVHTDAINFPLTDADGLPSKSITGDNTDNGTLQSGAELQDLVTGLNQDEGGYISAYLTIPPTTEIVGSPNSIQFRIRRTAASSTALYYGTSAATASLVSEELALGTGSHVLSTGDLNLSSTEVTNGFLRLYMWDLGVDGDSFIEYSIDGGTNWDDLTNQPSWYAPTAADQAISTSSSISWECTSGDCISNTGASETEANVIANGGTQVSCNISLTTEDIESYFVRGVAQDMSFPNDGVHELTVDLSALVNGVDQVAKEIDDSGLRIGSSLTIKKTGRYVITAQANHTQVNQGGTSGQNAYASIIGYKVNGGAFVAIGQETDTNEVDGEINGFERVDLNAGDVLEFVIKADDNRQDEDYTIIFDIAMERKSIIAIDTIAVEDVASYYYSWDSDNTTTLSGGTALIPIENASVKKDVGGLATYTGSNSEWTFTAPSDSPIKVTTSLNTNGSGTGTTGLITVYWSSPANISTSAQSGFDNITGDNGSVGQNVNNSPIVLYLEAGTSATMRLTHQASSQNQRIQEGSFISVERVNLNQKRIIDNINTPVNDQSSSGYIDIGNTRIQWGIDNGGAISNRTVNLPAPFSNSNYNIQLTPDQSGAAMPTIETGQTTTNSFQFRVSGDTGAIIGSSCHWQAIGLKPE